ncbi:hypothetical protein U3A55_00015, partial [Salarchaeum sp. III]|uniref:hypothetical protein n=1 Tax=Salarchaeum sp. III TaxID=3107927 RepID=UPI002EDA8A1A
DHFINLLMDEYCPQADHQDADPEIAEEWVGSPKEEAEPCFNVRERIVKVPVFLTYVDLSVDIAENISQSLFPTQITDIQCSLQSIESSVIQPSSHVLFKGTLMLEVEFESSQNQNSLQSTKIPIQWEKWIEVKWDNEPDIPDQTEREFTFVNEDERVGIHREMQQTNAHPIFHQVQCASCNSFHEPGSENTRINGTLNVSLSLYQSQYVTIS